MDRPTSQGGSKRLRPGQPPHCGLASNSASLPLAPDLPSRQEVRGPSCARPLPAPRLLSLKAMLVLLGHQRPPCRWPPPGHLPHGEPSAVKVNHGQGRGHRRAPQGFKPGSRDPSRGVGTSLPPDSLTPRAGPQHREPCDPKATLSCVRTERCPASLQCPPGRFSLCPSHGNSGHMALLQDTLLQHLPTVAWASLVGLADPAGLTNGPDASRRPPNTPGWVSPGGPGCKVCDPLSPSPSWVPPHHP